MQKNWVKVRLALARVDEKHCSLFFDCTSLSSLEDCFGIDPYSDEMKKAEGMWFEEVKSMTSIRDYIAIVFEIVTDAKRNDRRITTTDSLQICTVSQCVLPAEGDDAAVWLPLLCRSSVVLRHMFNEYVVWYNSKISTPGISLEREFLFSVVVIHPRFGTIFIKQDSFESHARIRRYFSAILNFNGECDVCMEEEGRHAVCQCCMKVCCKRCWRRLRKDAKSGNVPCPWKCEDHLRKCGTLSRSKN
eukprot:1165545-Rhodomonas_salina.1